MSLVEKRKNGNRSVRVQKRFNDESGHVHIIDMIEKLEELGWDQPKLVETAFECMHELYARENGIQPRTSAPQVITGDLVATIQTLQATVKQLEFWTNNLPNDAAGRQARKHVADLKDKLTFNVVQGSANFGGETITAEDEEEAWGDWE